MILEFILVILTLFITIHLITSSFEQKRKYHQKKKHFPGPIHLPIFGALIGFGIIKLKSLNKLHYQKIHEACKLYGSTFKAWAGQLSVLITEDFEIAKEVLNSPDFLPRFPTAPRFREITCNQNTGLIISSGAPWKEIRKFCLKTLKMYGFGEIKSTEEIINDELGYLMTFIETGRRNSNNEIYMAQYFKIPAYNCVWKAMSGSRFDFGDPDIHYLIDLLERGSKMQIGFDIEWVFHCLRYVPGFSHCWQHCKVSVEVQAYFRNIMEQRRQSGAYKTQQTNFIDYFLHTIDEEQKSNPNNTVYTDEQFIITCSDLLYAGIDTTSNSIEFTILYLTKYPSIQKKLQAEIDSVIGRERNPDYADIKLMPYARAVMLEVLRVANVLPAIARTSACDTEINGCFVEADVMAVVNLTMIHNDPKIWGDPENFRPERFLDENNSIINEEKLLTFGSGKRSCIGNTMAKVMWFKFITKLLQKYNFSVSPSHPELNTVADEGIANQTKPFYTIVTERNKI